MVGFGIASPSAALAEGRFGQGWSVDIRSDRRKGRHVCRTAVAGVVFGHFGFSGRGGNGSLATHVPFKLQNRDSAQQPQGRSETVPVMFHVEQVAGSARQRPAGRIGRLPFGFPRGADRAEPRETRVGASNDAIAPPIPLAEDRGERNASSRPRRPTHSHRVKRQRRGTGRRRTSLPPAFAESLRWYAPRRTASPGSGVHPVTALG